MGLCLIEGGAAAAGGNKSEIETVVFLGSITTTFSNGTIFTLAENVDLSKYSYIGAIENLTQCHPYNVTEYGIISDTLSYYQKRSHYRDEKQYADPRNISSPFFSILIPVTDRTDIATITVANKNGDTPIATGKISIYGILTMSRRREGKRPAIKSGEALLIALGRSNNDYLASYYWDYHNSSFPTNGFMQFAHLDFSDVYSFTFDVPSISQRDTENGTVTITNSNNNTTYISDARSGTIVVNGATEVVIKVKATNYGTDYQRRIRFTSYIDMNGNEYVFE